MARSDEHRRFRSALHGTYRIAPGAVATELWGITDPAEIERLSTRERTFLRADDVARAVVFMLAQPPHVTIRDLVILPQKQDI